MRILILGAGITGITAAYTLASRGHEVEVVEQEPSAAMQTTFSNGGQLSYSHAQPWANPAVFKKVFGWMLRDDAPLVLRPKADLAMIRWMMHFLLQCQPARADENCERMLRIALYSRKKMHEIVAQTNIEFDYRQQGILHIFSDQKSLDGAIKHAKFQEKLGCHEQILSRQECLAKEPSLQQAHKQIIGGIYSDSDESGDAHLFTQRLAQYCEQHLGVRFSYGVTVNKLHGSKQRITSIATSQGEMRADAYVLALGSYSTLLAKQIDIHLPIYPMKGYSITLPAWKDAPEVSITDDEKKVVFSRLGERVRAAGTAEFAGYNTAIRPVRIEQIFSSFRDLFPHVPTNGADEWACIRPQTPDGPPLVGRTPCANLYLHTGHGTLGWTHGAGTAYLLADIIDQRATEIRLAGYELSRYRKAG
ncbi:MAG: D-amino acid dehydrogenase [Alphaproteobacteria bacterium]|nr:MAG: D-amino acid dehydrogenase [Alphaproteobacteria bacterium]TAF16088.1 MAG: D-amino acid dehydrogenase [Alphaproteobacteria bacterium]TAF75904.1 MAG: D-amino acid dehydrogenase [Alphaproteobacteria bacterium]